MYNKCGAGSFILEFKFKEKWWGIDATKDKPVIVFVALRKIEKDEEILYDYSDNSTDVKTNFPWLKN